MAFLEENGIVHGNLKAENVLVCEHIKLKILHPKLINLMKSRKNDRHTEDESDWQWRAPEVTADKNALSTKSDVWSFGVVMYEMITYGEIPYKGFEKEYAVHGLSKGLRLPIRCRVDLYNTILLCWHQIPECRVTFEFLGDFLDDFEYAIETEYHLKDDRWKDKYMSGTLEKGLKRLKDESDDPKEHTGNNVESIVMADKHVDQPASNINVTTPGFDVTALYKYTAGNDDELSFNPGDIITNIDPADKAWWIGTTAKGARGKFPANIVEVCESPYSEVTKF